MVSKVSSRPQTFIRLSYFNMLDVTVFSVCEFLQQFPFTGICSNIQRLLKQYMLCFSGQDIADELREKVVLTLQQAVGVAESNRLADTYLRMARFCHQLGIDTLSHQECQVSFTQNCTQTPTYLFIHTVPSQLPHATQYLI